MKTILIAVFALVFNSNTDAHQNPSAGSSASDQTAGAQGDQSTRRVDYPESGVQLGTGWQTGASAKTGGSCVSYTEAHDTAQDKTLYIESISDKSSLMHEMVISAQIRVKAILASGNAKTDFADKVEIKNEYSNFIVRATVRNGATYAAPTAESPIDLRPSYRDLAKKDPIGFFRQCGDSFVSELYGGAELDAVLTFKTHSLDEQRTIKDETCPKNLLRFEESFSPRVQSSTPPSSLPP